MRVALVIGHSKTSQGARNSSFGVSEFEFNERLAYDIQREFLDLFNFNKDEIEIVYRNNGYAKLPNEINRLNPDLVVSLHCNAFDGHAGGCEMLYYHKSEKSKEIARIFQNHLVQRLENKDRGILARTSEDRGGYLLKMTHAPAVIVEPFFIDNNDEYLRAEECFHDGDLTKWYCECIKNSLDYLKNGKYSEDSGELE